MSLEDYKYMEEPFRKIENFFAKKPNYHISVTPINEKRNSLSKTMVTNELESIEHIEKKIHSEITKRNKYSRQLITLWMRVTNR